MRIARIEVFHVRPRWSFVRIEADNGAVGWGEVGIQSQRHSVGTAVETIAHRLIGRDPRRHQGLWQDMWRRGFYRGGAVLAAAVAGLDIALWDLRARSLGLPVHELLGGLGRERLQGYVWLGAENSDDDPDAVAAEAVHRMAEGVNAFKLTMPTVPPTGYGARLELITAQMTAVRIAIGTDRDVALDCHGRIDARQAPELLRALAPIRPLFIEEPLLPELTGALATLCAGSTIPIAAGERAFDRHESWRLLQAGITVLQPDIAQAGGISELLKICAAASLTGARVAPHCAIGPVALAASIQLGFAEPEVLIQEDPAMPYERDIFDSYMTQSSLLRMIDGYYVPNQQPGLGIEMDEGAIRAAAAVPAPYGPPHWSNPDGSYAEW